MDYSFRTLGLRKVYIEALEFNLPQFSALSHIATEEGRLREHEFHQGRYWDFVTYAVTAELWCQFLNNPRVVVRVNRGDGGVIDVQVPPL